MVLQVYYVGVSEEDPIPRIPATYKNQDGFLAITSRHLRFKRPDMYSTIGKWTWEQLHKIKINNNYKEVDGGEEEKPSTASGGGGPSLLIYTSSLILTFNFTDIDTMMAAKKAIQLQMDKVKRDDANKSDKNNSGGDSSISFESSSSSSSSSSSPPAQQQHDEDQLRMSLQQDISQLRMSLRHELRKSLERTSQYFCQDEEQKNIIKELQHKIQLLEDTEWQELNQVKQQLKQSQEETSQLRKQQKKKLHDEKQKTKQLQSQVKEQQNFIKEQSKVIRDLQAKIRLLEHPNGHIDASLFGSDG